MPCYTTATASVKLSAKTIDKAALAAAMKSEGIGAYSIQSDGTIIVSGQGRATPELTERINKAYTAEMTIAMFRARKWSVTKNQDGSYQISKVAERQIA